jgi:hypothetical protein
MLIFTQNTNLSKRKTSERERSYVLELKTKIEQMLHPSEAAKHFFGG